MLLNFAKTQMSHTHTHTCIQDFIITRILFEILLPQVLKRVRHCILASDNSNVSFCRNSIYQKTKTDKIYFRW